MEDMLYVLDLFGTVVFAMTGSLVARKKQLDVFGVVVIAFVTAVGGGTLRDIIIGNTPVFWVSDPTYIVAILIGVVLTIILIQFQWLPNRPLLIADAFGLSIFTVIGTQVALEFSVHWLVAIVMGIMSSVAGGMIRDVLSDEIPLVLRREIYATAALIGSVIYLVGLSVTTPQIAILIAVLVTLVLRLTSIWRGWSLPIHLIGLSVD